MSGQRERLKARNEKIYKRYKDLYDIKRMRYDDVLSQLADEFFLSQQSVNKIIISAKK